MDLQIGAAIRRARQAKGMTQAQLARLVGCMQSNVSHWETGRQSVPLTRLNSIATALDTTADTLVRAATADEKVPA